MSQSRQFSYRLLCGLTTVVVGLSSGQTAIAVFPGPAPVILVASAQTTFEQGLAAYQAGELQQAIQLWQQALNASETTPQQAQTLGNLAIAYYETGQYLTALQTNQTALDMFAELGNQAAVGQVQANLGNVYEALGDYERAIAAYQESLNIARAAGNRVAEGVSIGNLGYIYSVQGDQTAALTAYEQSLTIAREVGDREGESHRLLNMGIAHHALGQLDQAIQLYQQGLDVAYAIDHLPLEARILGNLGTAAADQGEYKTAIAYYEQSLDIAKTLQNPRLTATTLNNLGHTLLAANQLDAAVLRLQDAIEQLDQLRSSLADTYNVSVFDTQIYTYNLLTQVLIAQNRPAAALEIAEAGRARAFSDLLANRLSPASQPKTTGADDFDPFSVAEIQQVARQANATLVEYLLVPAEEFRVQGKQRGRTASIYIWVVQPDGQIHFRQQAIDPQAVQLDELVRMSRTSIGRRDRGGLGVVGANSNTSPSTADPPVDHLQSLHHVLIEPIQDLLPQNPDEQVIFVPQGDLFLVPFPALKTAMGDYLIQHHTILTAPSIQVLSLTHQQSSHRQATRSAAESARSPVQPKMLIVGNPEMPMVWNPNLGVMEQLSPLAGAEQEAKDIAAFFEVEALTGPAASEQVIKEQIEDAQIVHFATHGLLEYGNLQRSGVSDVPGAIALAPGDDQDGLLTAAEILDELSLKADLVVLSACDTGRGDITGDGVIGLSRSLIGAGATNVVVSLWAVPDTPTAELMVHFYQELKQGRDKAQALRQAMLATMQVHPDPVDWAAFTLIGEAQ